MPEATQCCYRVWPRICKLYAKVKIMKRVIFSTLFLFGLTAFASAQTANRNSSVTTRGVSKTTKSGKLSKGKKLKPSDTLNNRKTYHFTNGQRSTPTGAEATASNGEGYAALGKDTSAHVKKTPPRRRRSN